MSTLFVNIFTLLAVTQLVDNLFHSCDSFCENEYLFPMNSDPLLLLLHVLYVSYLSGVKKISINFSYPFNNLKNIDLVSS